MIAQTASHGSAPSASARRGGAIRLGLRLLAIAIAVLGWLDPSFAGRARPRIAVLDAVRSSSASPPDAQGALAASVAAQLAPDAVVTTHADPDADAWVVVADDQEARVPAVPDGVVLSLVTPATPATELAVEALDAPARVVRGRRVPIVATFAATGMRGAQSTVAVRSGDLPLAHATHRWTRDDERVTVRFDVLLPRPGVNHLIVDAVDGPGRTRRSRADTAVEAQPAPIGVLVYEGRPSWTTTFARRAIERDAAFAVRGVARVSRGIWTTVDPRASRSVTGVAPPRPPSSASIPLSGTLLGESAVALVGAPETLSASDVDALRDFVALGGGLVLAPDQRPAGPYTSLLTGASVDERLLEEPVRLPLAGADDLALTASELIEAATLPAGAHVIAPGSRADRASVWTVPRGRGQIVFVGALDAWRYRDRKDDGFDRWWSQLLEWLGNARLDSERVRGEPRVAPPGDPVAVSVRDQPRGDGASALGVALSRDQPDQPSGPAIQEPLRLWPDADADTFTGVINAPERPGVYAVSATTGPVSGPGSRSSHAPLIVDRAARRARAADDRWRLAAAARGGVVATPAEIDRVVRAARRADRPAEPVFPMRSLWWLIPFAGCLGGEWLLRRRAGLR